MESILKNKSYQFAIRVVRLSQHLQSEKKEFVLSKQVLRSGTGLFEGKVASKIISLIEKINHNSEAA